MRDSQRDKTKMKRTERKLKGKAGTRPIRQNRHDWRKKIIGHRIENRFSNKSKQIKIKEKEWERAG